MRLFNLKDVSPVGGIGDFVDQWKQPTPYRWQILGVAVALTFTLITLLVPKTERAPPAKATIIWISSWPEGRSDKEIIASNIANQKRKDAEAVVEKQREAFRKEFYRKLAKASGMDPDELAREYGKKDAAQTRAASPQPAGTPAK